MYSWKPEDRRVDGLSDAFGRLPTHPADVNELLDR